MRAVVTGADLPALADSMEDLGESVVNMRYASNNILADDKVLYYGHAVAAVAADSVHIAEEALGCIVVDYEVLPHVLDGRRAMQPDAPLLLPELRTNELGKRGETPTNVAEHIRHQRGDVEQGFAAAAVVVERVFQSATVHQGYIEPQNATALWNHDGRISVWCSTQAAFSVREQLAELLQVPVADIEVTPTEIGGGFGGKISVYLEPRGGAAVEEERVPAGEAGDDARRGAGGDRADLRRVDAGQDGGRCGGTADGCGG